MEFKGTKGKWWISGTEIMCECHTKIAKIYPTNMNDYNEYKYNAKVMAKSHEMLELLNELVVLEKKYFNDNLLIKHISKRAEKLIKEATEL